METLFFILGIASVVVTAIAVVAVVSIVKVTKLKNNVKRLERWLENSDRNNYADRVEILRRVENAEQHFTSQLDSRLDKLNSKHERSHEELHKVFSDYINNKRVK